MYMYVHGYLLFIYTPGCDVYVKYFVMYVWNVFRYREHVVKV